MTIQSVPPALDIDLEVYSGPKYVRIADAISDRIRDGRISIDQKLPPHRELAYQLSVTVGTITRAYSELEKRDLVRAEVGRGTFVKNPDDAVTVGRQTLNAWHFNTKPDFFRDDDPNAPVDLSYNFPPPGSEINILRQTLAEISQSNDLESLMGYLPHVGRYDHREAGADFLSWRGLDAHPDSLVITQGGHNGLVSVLAARTKPGDIIAAEILTNPGIRTIASMLGLRLRPLPLDAEGIIPEKLEQMLINEDISMIYTIPVLQNPTNSIMPLERRLKIAELAQNYDCFILEDDIFALMVENPPPTIASLAPDHTFYVTSVSKILSPGVRTGYVLPPKLFRTHVAAATKASAWMAPSLGVEVTTRWIRSGAAKHIIEEHRREAITRLNIMRDILPDLSIIAPDGALHGWLELPEGWTPNSIRCEANSHNILISDIDSFAVTGKSHINRVRICMSPPRSRERFKDAISTLACMFNVGPPFPDVMSP